VLIATDVMSRGMDFPAVSTVINYDLPQTTEDYIHRIGRTGRAGRKGASLTFYTEVDIAMLKSIANVMKNSGCDVPEWVLDLDKLGYNICRLIFILFNGPLLLLPTGKTNARSSRRGHLFVTVFRLSPGTTCDNPGR